jgi:hypothetical protein
MKITREKLKAIILEEACGCQHSEMEATEVLPDMLPDDPPMISSPADDDMVGSMVGDISQMTPQQAFAIGFIMGQSGDFTDMMPPREDSWAGGYNLVAPEMHTDPAAEEMGIEVIEINEQTEQNFASSDEIEDKLAGTLRAEGGAASYSVLEDSLADWETPEGFDLEDFLNNSGKISQHPEGDYFIGNLAETPRRLRLGAALLDIEPMRVGRPSENQQAIRDALEVGDMTEVWARIAGIK